ncbi:glycoside hydrolase family 97 protein [uncultured Bacteroides sp.]|uniref:glycoside hydrolase family 97 protein n=1 Tax=uncultured Bacteroides sp. TaxID=162156 RepID=UPI0026091E36|nr:glycoside hydrolase family 97 protein [uncultured Bacteroides sp.]
MKIGRLLWIGLFLCGATLSFAKETTSELTSPDGKLKIEALSDESGLKWSVDYNGVSVLQPSAINLILNGKPAIVGNGKEIKRQVINSSFATPFYKKAEVEDNYQLLVLKFAKGIQVEFRAYNDGAAYRIVSQSNKKQTINDEIAEFRFADDYPAFIPYVNDNRNGERYCYSFESYYDEVKLSEMIVDSLAISPLAVCLPDGMKAIVMDAGVENYPGMMLLKGEGYSLKAEFAPYPLEDKIGGHARLNLIPTKRANYIAKLTRKQTLPWRAIVVTTKDTEILNCDIAQRLAPACRIKDVSWIRPGKVAWDWWNNTNITGVDFASGMNTPTYKYYIDFAAANKLEYIIIDDGWSTTESLLDKLNPDINLTELIAYGNEKGVGIILWSSWRNLIGNDPDNGYELTERIMQHYADMGIKGFKVDFFDRDDQQVIASSYKIADAAARHHLLLDYHGLKPFGIQRAYPNIVNFEGVKGLENSKWEPRTSDGPVHNQPRYDVTAPYLRMLVGPMDYTPGAMMNAMKDNFFGNNDHPMSQGTRVHQMAMYAAFEAPLQMLADSPTKYMKEQECTDFIAQIPTTFDETVVLDGQLGEYFLLARRKGNVWYVSALTDWTPRTLTLDLSFLGKGSFKADIFEDGINAGKEATDYKHSTKDVTSTDKLTLKLSSGGGWAAIIR